ncbi:MAG: DUF433 domain-containing protein, partial [Planctomycetaceae bacterium]|nr:DUF433 domain-containing protein [Planctomycetaceae bacterium]
MGYDLSRFPGNRLNRQVTPVKDWTECDAVERHPHVVSGAWVFKGTRVPVSALFENLRDGASV